MPRRMSAITGSLAAAIGALGCEPGEGFCPTQPIVCEGDGCADAGAPGADCVTFEEAAALAQRGVRGIHKLTTAVDPVPWGFVSARALDSQSICKDDTCYLLPGASVSLHEVPETQALFLNWSGCSTSTEPQITIQGSGTDLQCTAHFAAAFIVLQASSTGWVDAPIHVTASSGCDSTNGCVVFYGGSLTLTAPTDPAYRFSGWSGCSSSTDPVLTLSNVTGPLPACVAEYVPVQ
jgi:hypothetical protein